MPVYSIEYTGPPGVDSITDATLAYVNVLRVQKEGIGFTIISEDQPMSPGERRVQYFNSSGKLKFPDVFYTPEILTPFMYEKIKVIYSV